MVRALVTRSDGKTIDVEKEEAEQADQTAKAKKVLLVDSAGSPLGTQTNKLEVDASLEVGDIEIGAVEIKNATDDTRAVVTSSNQLKVFDNVLNSLVPSQFDYISLTYTDCNPTTIVYKTGGSGGTIVSTLTLTYDADGNVLTVTKS